MTKIAIRLMTAVTSPINVAAVVAGKCLMTPDALATVLFSKAIGTAPGTPTSAQCRFRCNSEFFKRRPIPNGRCAIDSQRRSTNIRSALFAIVSREQTQP